jgi:hypothetical protein
MMFSLFLHHPVKHITEINFFLLIEFLDNLKCTFKLDLLLYSHVCFILAEIHQHYCLHFLVEVVVVAVVGFHQRSP